MLAVFWGELEVQIMFRDLEHPEIGWIERTGYPSWMQEETEVLNDEDDESEEPEGFCED